MAGKWRLALLVWLAASGPVLAQRAAPLHLIANVPLPGVRGRIDHFDMDREGGRLFMSALGNDTLEVFDLRENRLIHTTGGLREPQGVTYAPESNRIFVANGGDGTVRVFDGSTYELLKTVRLGSDADDTRYDPGAKRVWVGYGDEGNAGLAVLDGASGNLVARIPLPDHPESFQLEPGGSRIYVNIPSAGNLVAVVDRRRGKIVERWTLGGAQDNFPMALDEAHQRLFIDCREPAEVLVLDAKSGKVLARIPSVSHADDLWYDPGSRRIYVSGGGGSVTVIAQEDGDQYRKITDFKTPLGGRTSFLAPDGERFYLGIWGQGNRPEELQIYRLQH